MNTCRISNILGVFNSPCIDGYKIVLIPLFWHCHRTEFCSAISFFLDQACQKYFEIQIDEIEPFRLCSFWMCFTWRMGGYLWNIMKWKGQKVFVSSLSTSFLTKPFWRPSPLGSAQLGDWYTPHLRLALPSAWAAWPSATLWAKILVVGQPLAKPIIVLDEVYIYHYVCINIHETVRI